MSTSNLQPHVEHSITHISSSTSSAPGQRGAHEECEPHGSQRSDRAASQRNGSQRSDRTTSLPQHPQLRPRSPFPLPQPPLPARKPTTTSTRPPGGKVYGTRLNIIEINSQRLPTAMRGRGSSRGRAATSSTRRTANVNPTPTPRPRSSSQRQPSRDSRRQAPQDTSEDELEMLEGFDADAHVAERAAKGVVVKSAYHKPTANDLHGIERALWKPLRDVSWGFGAGWGGFELRTVWHSWVAAAYWLVFPEEFPHVTPRPMSDTFSTVDLNRLSNCRYRDAVRLRDPSKDFFGLKNPATEQERQENENKINKMLPNLFHCLNTEEGIDPYEGAIMPLALTATFFYGPKAIGAKYPGLFEKTDHPKDERKHLAILAYLATMVQFCLSEWKSGYFKQGTLNANYLLSVYICHYDGLKSVTSRARNRLKDSYNLWFETAVASAQAPTRFKDKSYVQPVIRPEDVRPDTPRHSPIPDRTTQTAPTAPGPSRLSVAASSTAPVSPLAGPSRLPARPSSTDRVSRRYSPLAPHLRRSPSCRSPTPDVPHIAPFGSPHPLRLSPPLYNPTPPPERDAEGRFTSGAKGKGRVMD